MTWKQAQAYFKGKDEALYELSLCLEHLHPILEGLVRASVTLLRIKLPANVHLGRQKVTVQVLGVLPPMHDKHAGFQAAGVGLAKSQWLQPFGE